MATTKHRKGKDIELTEEVVYILVKRENPGKEDTEVDRDIIFGVYKTEDSAIKCKEVKEERARKWGFEDVFAVKPFRMWE